ncbi:hypothetical protein COY90_00325 [Candidatus Roizmanbacteria bacterium CG_4_10_14_0_8_um_filter_39_9]|uniref:Glycosyl transferase family 1 domain-containing protein n=1 Tax=Candidatus Roizmanbacteria bacterium CG_4_10_14_0_8_um_filter_39_9 TaxID=1974829 RepID=A0A2M7QE50_9BACT|nr:MAG: hypothetical protein COY90_00325 [Candidatus Roizmanbacteria bacterium CG_4_10_14_0_8_um_filter_39_9]
MANSSNKVAIVYDWIDKWGGVERLLPTLYSIYPDATFYTSYVDLKDAKWARRLNIKTSFLQHFPSWIKKSRILSFIFYPIAFESFDFSAYDTVISVTSSFAKSIITKPKTRHICYLLTPTRYIWLYPKEYLHGVIRWALSIFMKYVRHWDSIASRRPDLIISLSKTVRDRCKKYYGITSEVLYPPFEIDYWEGIRTKFKKNPFSDTLIPFSEKKPYFLVVSRLEPYKKIEIAVEACRLTKSRLIVVGKGSRQNQLKRAAGSETTFLQDISDEQLVALYMHAEGLIMPQNEDFGYTSLEAQICGCPVIAYGHGGNAETVIQDMTGVFFYEQSSAGLSSVLERWHKISYNLKRNTNLFGKQQAGKFSKDIFISRIKQLISLKEEEIL